MRKDLKAFKKDGKTDIYSQKCYETDDCSDDLSKNL